MKRLFKHIILFALLIILLAPIYFIVIGMLLGKVEAESIFSPIINSSGSLGVFLFPEAPTLGSVVNLIIKTTNYYRAFWNSCIIVIPIIGLQILIAAPAAWTFSQVKSRIVKAIYFVYLFLMILPFVVTMLPNYLMLQQLKLLDSVLSIILPAAFSTMPVFIMERFFSKIPHCLLEEAKCMGANNLAIFIRIGLPLGLPGIVASSMLSFSKYWNDIEAPILLLSIHSKWPSSLWLSDVSISFFGESMTACAMNMVLPLLIFVYGSRQLKNIGDAING